MISSNSQSKNGKGQRNLVDPQYGNRNAKIIVNTFEDKVCCGDNFHKDCFKRNFRSELKPYHSKKLSTDLVWNLGQQELNIQQINTKDSKLNTLFS